MGKRINLADLATEQVLEAPVPQIPSLLQVIEAPPPTTVPVHQVAANPINPRELSGDLGDLESMRTVGQLQPCVVVTRAAFLAAFPDLAPAIAAADYVVVAGSRRRVAAEHFGLPTLDVVVRDNLAASRAQFFAAAVTENIDRRNFDVLEEARAVQRLALECGSGQEAGEILCKSKGWVSQRLALLRLSPEMQTRIRSGELPVRDGRRLAALPEDEQLPAWEAEREQATHDRFTAVNQRSTDAPASPTARAGGVTPESPAAPPSGSSPDDRSRASRVSFPADAAVDEIARVLRSHLSAEDVAVLVTILTT